jgi:hypothetical protein
MKIKAINWPVKNQLKSGIPTVTRNNRNNLQIVTAALQTILPAQKELLDKYGRTQLELDD